MPTQQSDEESLALRFDQVSVLSPSGHDHLLHQISFCIDRLGEKVGIVGASGSGKTTLLRLINRLIDPSEGQIFWQGKDLRHYDSPALRQQIMLVPQEPRLLGMTVEQTLAYPLQLQNCSVGQIQQQVQTWCQRLGVPEAWRLRQEQALSVGQRQWISLVRALIVQPQVLLLDEPTSALDPGRIEQLIQTLQQMNCTILLASHQQTVVEKLCDRLLWLDKGTLRQDQPMQTVNWPTIQATLEAHEASTTDWDTLD
jgi:D-methionine transport system ATP-binding protein